MTTRPEPPHPSRGGSTGYSRAMRSHDLHLEATGNAHLCASSVSTRRRWRLDGINRKVQTGGVEKHTLVGEDLVLMSIHRLLFPKAHAEEVIAFHYVALFKPTSV